MTEKINAGSRGSKLALAQVKEVFSLLEKKGKRLEHDLVVYVTKGDKDKKTPLSDGAPDDFFTDTLDEALLAGDVDITIHSAKDLPKVIKNGIAVFAITESLDETDAFVGKVKIADLKPGAKVGTSSTLRKEFIQNLNPNITIVDIRGTIEERLSVVDEDKIDGVIVATCALKRLGLTNRITDVLPYDTTALQGQLAVVGREQDIRLREIFSNIDVRKKYGKVTLVGAGPGDPDLITLKAVKILQETDCVFYDYLIDKKLLEHAKKAEKIYVGKRKGEKVLAQSELSKMLRQKAQQGKNVVRLKGGDPLIFGRGADEIEYLHSYFIETQVIPGVSSATGIPSSLGIPLTARGIASSVAFVSGHSEDEDSANPLPVAIPKVDMIVFLMGLTKLGIIVESLRIAGWKETVPVIIVSKGSYPDEKIVCGAIENIEKLAAQEKLDQPALIVAGETVKFWQKKQSATKTKNILYLGTNPEKYRMLGNIIHLPMIDIVKKQFSPQEYRNLVESLEKYQLVILTSRFAVKYFMEIIGQEGYSIVNLGFIDFAAVGQDTAKELRSYRIDPKVIASVETSEGLLANLLKEYNLKDKKILFPRSALPNPYLMDELKKRGAEVTELTVYDNKKPTKADISFEHVDQVFFTSPSTVKNFLEDYGTIPSHWKILCKGAPTQKALKDAGYESEVLIYDEIS